MEVRINNRLIFSITLQGALGGLFGAMAITFGTTMLPIYPEEKAPLTCISNCNVQAFKNISKNALLKPRTPVIPLKYVMVERMTNIFSKFNEKSW